MTTSPGFAQVTYSLPILNLTFPLSSHQVAASLYAPSYSNSAVTDTGSAGMVNVYFPEEPAAMLRAVPEAVVTATDPVLSLYEVFGVTVSVTVVP